MFFFGLAERKRNSQLHSNCLRQFAFGKLSFFSSFPPVAFLFSKREKKKAVRNLLKLSLYFIISMLNIMVNIIIVFGICCLLSVLAYLLKVLDLFGSFAALILGLIVGVFGGLRWLIVLIVFLFISFTATKYKYNFKKNICQQEGEKGERRWDNVIANGTIPAIIALLFFFFSKDIISVIFIVSISVAASDTLASEIGLLSKKVYMITNLKKTEPGVNGGVSWLGTTSAFFGALLMSLIGWIILSPVLPRVWILVPVLIGFLGCQIDSLLGATLEGKFLTKHTVNLISIGTGALISGVILWLIYCY